jgi:hypothetical protein
MKKINLSILTRLTTFQAALLVEPFPFGALIEV